MTTSAATVDEHLRRRYLPFRVCVAPAAQAQVAALEGDDVPPGMEAMAFTPAMTPGHKACVLVLAPEDLRGKHRAALLQIARDWRPARPVLVGGARDRDTLLDAINNWRVFRVVADRSPPSMLHDALVKAHEALKMEVVLDDLVGELQTETRSLEQAVAGLRETQWRLVHVERLATLGRVTGGLIPVIDRHLQPLAELKATAVLQRVGDPRLRQLMDYAFDGVGALHVMLDDIRAYADSRPERYDFEEAEVDPVVEWAVSFSRFDPLSQNRQVRQTLRSGARARMDRLHVRQVLINLLRNAFQATPPGGAIEVRTAADGRDVLIEVKDSGPGISEDAQRHLFEPFFSTKGDEGTGLGLTMCRIAVERHGGSITCTSADGSGACFSIRLPAMT